jgi:hypothetical protein
MDVELVNLGSPQKYLSFRPQVILKKIILLRVAGYRFLPLNLPSIKPRPRMYNRLTV